MMSSPKNLLPSLERAHQENLEVAALPPQESRALVALIVLSELERANGIKQLHEMYICKSCSGLPHMLTVEPQLREIVGFELPPIELRCHDLRPRVRAATYRQASEETPPDFHGFSFGDAIDQAIEGLTRFSLGPKPDRFDIVAYAWPFQWLRYPEGDVILVADRFGKLHGFRMDVEADV